VDSFPGDKKDRRYRGMQLLARAIRRKLTIIVLLIIPRAFVDRVRKNKVCNEANQANWEIWGARKNNPHMWGGKKILFTEQVGEFSPETESYPQFSASYPQKIGLAYLVTLSTVTQIWG
jgi:hypothetical protein